MISLPILAVLLVVIFGSVAAAGLPLAIGVRRDPRRVHGAARRSRTFTDVSIFAVNIVTIIGLGLAIDYGLFMVSRFREEIRRGQRGRVEDALARTMATAGRTVAVSGITVAISLAGLLIFPQVFLRSMGFGGMSAVLIAMLAALTLLPALLAMLGPKVDALSVRPLLRRLFRRPAAAPGPRRRTAPGPGSRTASCAVRSSTPSPSWRCWSRWRCRSCGWSSAGSTSGCCRPARRAGWSPRRSRPTSRRATSGPIEAIVTLPDAGRLPRRRRGPAVLRRRRRRRPGVDGATVTGAAGDTARVSIAYDGDPIGRGGAGAGRRDPRGAGTGRRARCWSAARAAVLDRPAGQPRRRCCRGWR